MHDGDFSLGAIGNTVTASVVRKQQMTHHPEQTDWEVRSPKPNWTPSTAADMENVREQVGRILSSASFRNSKRFPVFLRYTVEHALASTEPLKERTIGHEVFARDAAYDTAQDPVVRMTAAEVRKRLTQYYLLPEHRNELLISYQPGSYVPEFAQRIEAAPAETALPAPEALPSPFRSRHSTRWLAVFALAASVLAIVGTLAVMKVRGTAAPDAVARFWAPLLESSSPVLICIGDPGRVPQPGADNPVTVQRPDDLTIEEYLRTNSVRYTDSVTLALVAGELRTRSKPFRIRRPAATELKDLREGPVVLIGGFNNPWTLRLSEGLRFTLATDKGAPYISDSQHPDDRTWQPAVPGRLLKHLHETYGLITRVKDPSTGHSVLTVAGLVFGTSAAAECLVDAGCIQSAEQLGGDLSRENVQIVVSAAVIGEDAGAPRVVATHSW